ncbi:MAG: hypothetical protein ABI680_15075 [Chthoniobacteraceae bacterium]
MRANFSEQDLTDYALNELDAHERLYVESMLAASEECRADVCKMIDLAQSLEAGFERKVARTEILSLKPEQRANLIRPHFTARYAIRDFAAAIGLAACTAFAITHFGAMDLNRADTAVGRMAQVSSDVKEKVSAKVSQVVQSPDTVDVRSAFESLRALVADPSNFLPVSEGMPEPAAICTPPSGSLPLLMMESAQL